MNEILKCSNCGGEMEEGFVMDESLNTQSTAHWIAGKPIQGFFGSTRTKGKNQFPIQAYRCRQCGRLEWYAPGGAA
jgi:uncharacterized protein DUF6487